MQKSSGSEIKADLFTVKAIHKAAPTYTMVQAMRVLTATRTSRLDPSNAGGLSVGKVDEEEPGKRVSSSSWHSESCCSNRSCRGRLRRMSNMKRLQFRYTRSEIGNWSTMREWQGNRERPAIAARDASPLKSLYLTPGPQHRLSL